MTTSSVSPITRPTLLRLLPARLRTAAWFRLYYPPSPRWRPLYDDASLVFAPGRSLRVGWGDWSSSCIAFTGIWEYRVSRVVARLAQHGGLLVDVGANLGYFSVVWLGANPANRVVAVEPSTKVRPLLEENLRRNGFSDRCQLIAAAASDRAQALPFSEGPGTQLGWGGHVPSGGEAVVPAITLDELLEGQGDVACLKIDVEGMEPAVLAGAARLLSQQRIRCVIFERNVARAESLGFHPDTAERLLAAHGYRSTRLEQVNPVMNLMAVPTAALPAATGRGPA